MDTSPLVTVLVPTYDRPDFLRLALESALGQTYTNLEILVLDDTSPGTRTTEVGKEFVKRDDRVHYMRHDVNKGIALNWRFGIEIAKGDYFCFLHDDDTWEPRLVEKLVTPMEADPLLSVAFSDHWMMSDDGVRQAEYSDAIARRFKRYDLPPGALEEFANRGVLDGCVPIVASLYRRRLFDPAVCTNPEAQGCSDLWMIYNAFRVGGAYYVAERLVNYRGHEGGMSSSKPIYMSEGKLFVLSEMQRDSRMHQLQSKIRDMCADAYTQIGVTYLRTEKREDARRALWNGLKVRPQLRGAVALLLSFGGRLGSVIARQLRSA